MNALRGFLLTFILKSDVVILFPFPLIVSRDSLMVPVNNNGYSTSSSNLFREAFPVEKSMLPYILKGSPLYVPFALIFFLTTTNELKVMGIFLPNSITYPFQ